MNPIVHFELPVDEKSKEFYKQIFGWQYDEMPEMNYTIARTCEVDDNMMPKMSGSINGGLMSVSDNGGLYPVLVISVPSIDEYLEKIRNMGGTVIQEKAQVGEMGYYARFLDPAGVVTGIWETIQK